MSRSRMFWGHLDWVQLRRTFAAFLFFTGLFWLYSLFVTPLVEGPPREPARQEQQQLGLLGHEPIEEQVANDAETIVLRWGHPEDVFGVHVSKVSFEDSRLQGLVELASEYGLFDSKLLKSLGIDRSALLEDAPQALALDENPTVEEMLDSLNLAPDATIGDAFRALSLRIGLYRTKRKALALWEAIYELSIEPPEQE